MKKSSKLAFVLAACLGVAGAAYASDDKEDNGSDLACKLFPMLCGVSTQGGNGGGVEPPK